MYAAILLSEGFGSFVSYQYARIGGELNSLRVQLKTQETDMKDYKDIAKQYREQLVKVKVQYTLVHKSCCTDINIVLIVLAL